MVTYMCILMPSGIMSFLPRPWSIIAMVIGLVVVMIYMCGIAWACHKYASVSDEFILQNRSFS